MYERSWQQAQHPALAQIRGYWEGLRSEDELPSRSMIDPRGLERALEHAFIAERVSPGVARLRLAGMHLNDLLGMEVRGMPLTALFAPDAREAASAAVERAFAEKTPVELCLDGEHGVGRPPMTAVMLLLPLRNEFGQVDRILGGMAAEGEIGRPPRRFLLADQRTLQMTGPAALAAPAVAPAVLEGGLEGGLQGGLAEAPARFDAEPDAPAPRKRGHLRLVHSAD